MTLKDVRKALAGSFDSVGWSNKDKLFVAKRGYFYRHGMTVDTLSNAVRKLLPTAVVLDGSDHWHAWPKDSYMEVRFTVDPPKKD